MKKLLAALACLSLTASAAPAATDYPTNENAIVKVMCDEGMGTATRVTSNAYISVNHVTGMHNCKVDGTPIEVTYANAKQDFSTFIGPVGKDVIPISCEGFKHLEGYVARGYAFNDTDPWFQPLIAVASFKGKTAFVGDVFPGMSGGPIVDKDGRTTGTVNHTNPTGGVDLKDTVVCGAK